MRKIKNIHRAVSAPIADLVTFRALPTHSIDHIDPFLFLNHHGYQIYPKNNNGLPFGPHPHRGFETVTFIVKGDLTHQDSSGSESIIKAGGVQWMTAGRGIIHSEVSSEEFKENGGELEILQLWLNLPAKHKMVEPSYTGLQENDIPKVEIDHGKVVLNAISGSWEGQEGAFHPITDIQLSSIYFQKSGEYSISIEEKRNVFFYVVKGKLKVNTEEVKIHQLMEFENSGKEIKIKAEEESIILLGHALPYKEPIVAQGPFVMNSEEEIFQAYEDYRQGKFA